MTTLSDFPITARWPAAHPDRIQFYAFPTPNGVKCRSRSRKWACPTRLTRCRWATRS